jgi:hypothetical protein
VTYVRLALSTVKSGCSGPLAQAVPSTLTALLGREGGGSEEIAKVSSPLKNVARQLTCRGLVAISPGK